MTKEEYLEMASKHYDGLHALNKVDNFCDYEPEFSGIMNKLSKEIIEKNLSELFANTIS